MPVATYKVTLKKNDRSREHKGTLSELNDIFSQNARDIKTLVRRVQNSYAEREACCYNRTYVYSERIDNQPVAV